ncbi:hypothetical protein DVH05_014139 [Phytophthora capsici]|nr:hypothetical protein DVH05_014139 [Phytophthora capsici]
MLRRTIAHVQQFLLCNLMDSHHRPKGRPRLPGGSGRAKKKFKKVSYTADEKLHVLNHLAEHNDIVGTINSFYPDLSSDKFDSRRTLILSWRRKRSNIEKLSLEKNGAYKRKARGVGLGTILPEREEALLVRWVNEMRAEGVPVTTTMLRIQAQEIAKEAAITQFKGSWCWQKHFKKRHRLSLRCRTRQGQLRPPELDKIAADFAKEVKAKAAEVGAKRIFNADQTGIFF